MCVCVKYSSYFLPHFTLQKPQIELVGGDSDHCGSVGLAWGVLGLGKSACPPHSPPRASGAQKWLSGVKGGMEGGGSCRPIRFLLFGFISGPWK